MDILRRIRRLWVLVMFCGVCMGVYLPETTPTPVPTGRVVELERRNPIWRDGRSSTTHPACMPMTLSSGTIYLGSRTVTVGGDRSAATFTPLCKEGRPVTVVDSLPGIRVLTSLRDEWRDWVQNTDEGGFHSSLSPLLYSLSSSTVICVLLNLVIFDGPRRPFLQKFSITLSSVYLLTGFIFATRKLELQYNEGFQEGNLLRYELETSRAINILHVIFDTILLSMEVQTLMSLFPRQKEKRLIFWVGGALIVVSQVLWSVSVFDPNSNRKESALPAFVYLFQISISIMYFGCVVYYAVTKHRSAFSRSLGFFSFVSMLASVAPIALFIVDVGGWWVVEWTDSVSWLTSILSIVTVWEWARRVESRERHREKDRVLGRQIYEDEGQVLPKIFRSKSSSDDSDDRHNEDNDESGGAIELENLSQEEQTSSTRTKAREIVMNHMVMDNTPLEDNTDNPDAHRWYQTFRRAIISPFLWISDQIIELGYFGISRDSKSPASDNNNPQTTWDHPNDTESNHTTSSRQQMPRFVH